MNPTINKNISTKMKNMYFSLHIPLKHLFGAFWGFLVDSQCKSLGQIKSGNIAVKTTFIKHDNVYLK